jgi:hypothetical protein
MAVPGGRREADDRRAVTAGGRRGADDRRFVARKFFSEGTV